MLMDSGKSTDEFSRTSHTVCHHVLVAVGLHNICLKKNDRPMNLLTVAAAALTAKYSTVMGANGEANFRHEWFQNLLPYCCY